MSISGIPMEFMVPPIASFSVSGFIHQQTHSLFVEINPSHSFHIYDYLFLFWVQYRWPIHLVQIVKFIPNTGSGRHRTIGRIVLFSCVLPTVQQCHSAVFIFHPQKRLSFAHKHMNDINGREELCGCQGPGSLLLPLLRET